MENLVRGCWEFQFGFWHQLILVGTISIVLRAIMCSLRAMPLTDKLSHFPRKLWELFYGFGSITEADYWLPTFVGTLELYAFPVLLAFGQWTVIGAWIGFKAVANHLWRENRNPFNRFLIGNALVVLLSIQWLTPHIRALACV